MARILTITPYDRWFPPKNGGTMRAFYLMRELSRSHEVHAVTLQPVSELKGSSDGFEFPATLTAYGPPAHSADATTLGGRIGSAIRARWLQRDLRRSASSVLLKSYGPIRSLSKQHKFDVVVFNVLDSLVTLPVVRRLFPGSIRILNSENVDHSILRDQLADASLDESGGERATIRARYDDAFRLESTLAGSFHGFWAASDADRDTLVKLNHQRLPGYVVPNGVDTVARPYDPRQSKSSNKSVLFCGSLNYFPNRDGLEWFYRMIWPAVRAADPASHLRVVGRGSSESDFLDLRADPSVSFLGEVEDVTTHYHDTGVCIVPLRSGSGTRLKLLEAMSMGNPVVSTPIGASGIKVTDGANILLRDQPLNFAQAIVTLLNDRSTFDSVRLSARNLVEKEYDWTVSSHCMNASIIELLGTQASNF